MVIRPSLIVVSFHSTSVSSLECLCLCNHLPSKSSSSAGFCVRSGLKNSEKLIIISSFFSLFLVLFCHFTQLPHCITPNNFFFLIFCIHYEVEAQAHIPHYINKKSVKVFCFSIGFFPFFFSLYCVCRIIF